MGFEGEVGGNLSLAQQPAKPLQLFGNLNIIQGFYEGYGQALTVEDGQVLFNGPFRKFPFEDHSGKFHVDVELDNSEFSFSSHWPSITDFNANLNFTNNSYTFFF